MKSIKEYIKNVKTYEWILVVLVVLYILSGVKTPYELSMYVNNTFAYLSFLALLVLLYIMKSNVLIILLIFAGGLVFISRSAVTDYRLHIPSEYNKVNKMKTFNNGMRKRTLEEEMVGTISNKPDNIPNPASYNPVLCDSHCATCV